MTSPASLRQADRRIHDDGRGRRRVFVVLVVMVRRDDLAQNVQVQLGHVRTVAADGADQPALATALGRRQILGWKQRRRRGRTAEDDVGLADLVLQHVVVLSVFAAENCELGVGALKLGCRVAIVASVEVVRPRFGLAERSLDDVHPLDVCAAQKQRQSDRLVRLFPGPERRDRADVSATLEK